MFVIMPGVYAGASRHALRSFAMGRRADAKIVALLVFVVALFFADVFILGTGFYVRDVYRDYLPSRFVLRQAVLGGELPLWNRFYSAGQPLAANPGFQTFYPGTWLCLLPSFLLGFNLQIVLHVALAAAGMYLMLRDRGTGAEASIFGAIAFALGGAILSLTNLLPFLTSVAWWPLIAMFARRRSAGGLALTFGMLLLAAEQAVIAQTLILIVAAAWPINRRVVLGCLLAFGIAAVQLVPALDLMRDTARARRLSAEDAAAWRMPAVRPVELFYAHAFGRITDDGEQFRGAWRYTPPRVPLIFSIYCGALVPLLAIAGLVLRVRGWLSTTVLVLLSYALAIGGASYFRLIRYPEKIVLIGLFALVAFAATALDRFDRRLAIAAIFITLIDLGMHVNELAPRMPRRFFDPPPLAAQVDRRARLFHEAAWPMARIVLRGGDETYWSQRDALMPFTPALYGIATALELDINLTNLTPTERFVETMWRARAKGASPMPYMALANVGTVAAVDQPVRLVRIPPRPRYFMAHSRVLRAAETANTATIDVDVAAPEFLEISVTPHRYWRATIDGAPAKLEAANIAFQRVAVPAGRHTVAMRYDNPVIRWSAWVSAISLLAAIIAAFLRR
jgi:hypothetical protein